MRFTAGTRIMISMQGKGTVIDYSPGVIEYISDDPAITESLIIPEDSPALDILCTRCDGVDDRTKPSCEGICGDCLESEVPLPMRPPTVPCTRCGVNPVPAPSSIEEDPICAPCMTRR